MRFALSPDPMYIYISHTRSLCTDYLTAFWSAAEAAVEVAPGA